MLTRSKTPKRGQVQHCYLDEKNKSIVIGQDVHLVSEEQSNGWADLPIIILEKNHRTCGEQKHRTWACSHLRKLEKFANVCNFPNYIL